MRTMTEENIKEERSKNGQGNPYRNQKHHQERT